MEEEVIMGYKTQYNKWKNNPELEPYLMEELLAMTEQEIEEAFYKDLEFGTGGIRGIVGAGTNRMNIYTIRKANVGFARYLLNRYHDVLHRGVVISHDNRHFSKVFALESARVMATYGIKAYLFEDLRPTPELSFAVRHLNAIGGIMITASHNPPIYNGYKIYDEHGCQLVPELADEVIQQVNAVDDIFSIAIEAEATLREKGMIVSIGAEVDRAYIDQVKNIQLNPNLLKQNITIAFSPLHGTASTIAPTLFQVCGYKNVYFVEHQMIPDPNFTSVTSPNPEEKEAFHDVIELGQKVSADLLVVTDPDADRVGLAVKHHGEYVMLNGNQTAAILLYYLLTQLRIQNRLPKNGVVINTIVSSDLAQVIAKDFGLKTESTLTGFKFIGHRIEDLAKTDQAFIFGYEESYGYLVQDFVRDKDAFQAIVLACEAASYFKHFDKTLVDVLHEIYEKYGYYHESLVNLVLEGKAGQERIQRIMESLRQHPFKELSSVPVSVTEDYLIGQRVDEEGITPITLPTSNVLKYVLKDGSWVALRPSGTEPKLKIYVSAIGPNHETSLEKCETIKKQVLDRIATVA